MANTIAEKFHVENNVIITTKDRVTVEEVTCYLKENLTTFREGSQFVVVCGTHGYEDGSLGSGDGDLFDDYRGMFQRFQVHPHFHRESELIKERKFQMGQVITVYSRKDQQLGGKYVLDEMAKVTINIEFERILALKKPIVLILASCWSYRSEISNILRSVGLYTAINILEECGKISQGKMFLLDPDQQEFLRKLSNEGLEIKDFIVTGTGNNL